MTRSNTTLIGIPGSATAIQTTTDASVVVFDLIHYPLGNLFGLPWLRILHPSFERSVSVLGEQVDARQRDRQYDSHNAVGTASPGPTSGIIHYSCTPCKYPYALVIVLS